MCAPGSNPAESRNVGGVCQVLVSRNSNLCYLRKIEEALGNNGKGILAMWPSSRSPGGGDQSALAHHHHPCHSFGHFIYLCVFLFLICWSYQNESCLRTALLDCSVPVAPGVGPGTAQLLTRDMRLLTQSHPGSLAAECTRGHAGGSWNFVSVRFSPLSVSLYILLDIPAGLTEGHLKQPSVSRGNSLLLLASDTTCHPAAHARALGQQALAVLPPEGPRFHPLLSIPTSALHSAVQATSPVSTVWRCQASRRREWVLLLAVGRPSPF